MKRTISIDHGNRLMKTVGQAFPSLPILGGYMVVKIGQVWRVSAQ